MHGAQLHGMLNEWAWKLVGAVNENAVSRKQRMRKSRQSSARRLARPALGSTERDIAERKNCQTQATATVNG